MACLFPPLEYISGLPLKYLATTPLQNMGKKLPPWYWEARKDFVLTNSYSTEDLLTALASVSLILVLINTSGQ